MCMPVEPRTETPTSRDGIAKSAAKRGAHHVKIGERDRQALGQQRLGCGGRRELSCSR